MISLRLKSFCWWVLCATALLFVGCEGDGSSSNSVYHQDHYYGGYGGMWYDDDYPDYVVLPPGTSTPPDQQPGGSRPERPVNPHPEHPIAGPRPEQPIARPSQRPDRSSNMSSRQRPSIPSRSRSGGGGRRR